DSRGYLVYLDPSLFSTRLYGRADLNVARLKFDEFNPDRSNAKNRGAPELFRQTREYLIYAGLQVGIALPHRTHIHGYYRYSAPGRWAPIFPTRAASCARAAR